MPNNTFDTLHDWHEQLGDNKCKSAILRRCKSLSDIFFCPVYYDLCQYLELDEHALVEKADNIAVIAGVLAHIKPDAHLEKFYLARQMSVKEPGSDNEKISRNRFKRLLMVKDKNKLFRQLVRVTKQIPLIDLNALAKDLYYWNEETKHKWASQYYCND